MLLYQLYRGHKSLQLRIGALENIENSRGFPNVGTNTPSTGVLALGGAVGSGMGAGGTAEGMQL